MTTDPARGTRVLGLDEVRLAGVLDTEATTDGVVLRRLPRWTRPQIPDVLFDGVVNMPAGVRIELVTDSPVVELDVLLTLLQINADPLRPAAFDAVVDGTLVASETTTTGHQIVISTVDQSLDFTPGDPTTIRFAGLPTQDGARVEVWLPQAVGLELRQVRIADGATAAPAPSIGRRWIHHGSSISHCAEADQPTGTWPAVAARLAGVDLQNLAFAGQAQLDPFVARTIRDLPADLISVKAGINVLNADSMRERAFTPALHGFLDTIREGHPTTPLLLVTPIVCPVAEDHPGPTAPGRDGLVQVPDRPADLAAGALTLRRIRQIAAEVVTARRAAGDEHLHLLDGPALFGLDDVADLPDGLHPNAAGYRRMGERFHDLAFVAGPFHETAEADRGI